MKTLLRIFAAVMLMGLITVSCSKPGNVYDGTMWKGDFDSCTMTLTFQQEGNECSISFFPNIPGMDGLTLSYYNVEWRSPNSFDLYWYNEIEGQSQHSYSGTISGEKMELKTPREGCLIFVYQLTRVYLTY